MFLQNIIFAWERKLFSFIEFLLILRSFSSFRMTLSMTFPQQAAGKSSILTPVQVSFLKRQAVDLPVHCKRHDIKLFHEVGYHVTGKLFLAEIDHVRF